MYTTNLPGISNNQVHYIFKQNTIKLLIKESIFAFIGKYKNNNTLQSSEIVT